MKAWNTPVMETLEINETARGSFHITRHDGYINYSNNGRPAEECASGPIEK